jgi:hypothetical protein
VDSELMMYPCFRSGGASPSESLDRRWERVSHPLSFPGVICSISKIFPEQSDIFQMCDH